MIHLGDTSFIKTAGQVTVLHVLISAFLDKRQARRMICNGIVANSPQI
jgi:hypothetical protein